VLNQQQQQELAAAVELKQKCCDVIRLHVELSAKKKLAAVLFDPATQAIMMDMLISFQVRVSLEKKKRRKEERRKTREEETRKGTDTRIE
jgi:hypothetical protein